MQLALIAPRLEWHPVMAEAAIKVITVVAIIMRVEFTFIHRVPGTMGCSCLKHAWIVARIHDVFTAYKVSSMFLQKD